MKNAAWIRWAVCLVLIAAGVAIVGCEDTNGYAISVSPSEKTLNTGEGAENSVVFTATLDAQGGTTNYSLSFAYPLVWTVSNPELGGITGSGGNSAVYTRTSRTGSNPIMVRDHGDASGVAAVTQY